MSNIKLLEEVVNNKNVQAFLRVIREGETSQTDEAYRTIFGGGQFASFVDHPRIVVTKGQYTSSAAGAYQFLSRTWDGLVKQYGFTDFSPKTQDLAAVALILGRKALADVIEGRLEQAIKKCALEWASLPFSPYGQPTKTLAQAKAVYEKYGGVYTSSVEQEQEELPKVSEAALVETKKESKKMSPFIPIALEALVQVIPKLGQLFGSGSEVSNRNAKAAEVVVNIAKEAVNAANEQELVEQVKSSPEAAKAVQTAVQENWFQIVEVGGGIVEARKAALEMQKAGTPLWKNPAFVITILLMIPAYAVIASVISLIPGVTWSADTQMLVVGLSTNIVAGIMGFWLGSSFGSQRKDVLKQ